MPILTSTPATPPTYDFEAYYPHVNQADDFGPGFFVAFNPNAWVYRATRVGESPNSGTMIAQAGPGAGGTGVLKRLEGVAGIPYALRYSTTSALAGDVIRPPLLIAGYDPTADAGNLVGRPDFRVLWWREVWRYTGGFGDGGSGRVWSWDVANTVGVNWAQAGAAVQQHGVYGDGAGGLEYRSYSATPALVETVAIPAATLGPWILFDHQFISWAPGRAASYELRVNGATVVQRDFGTAVLPFPTVNGRRLQLNLRMTSAAGIAFCAYMHVRTGRFTIDGLELRS